MVFSKASWFSSTIILFLSLSVQLARVGCRIENNYIEIPDNYTEIADNCTILVIPENVGSIQISSLLPPHQENCSIIIYEIYATLNSSIIEIISSPYVINIKTSSTPSYPNETEVTESEATTNTITSTTSSYPNETENTESEATSNIIKINTSPTPSYPNETEVTASEATTKNIFITFEEISFFKDGTNVSVTMERWNFTDENYKVERVYLSRTSYLRVLINVTGNWTKEMVELSFKEIEFSVFNMSSSKKKSVVTVDAFGDLVRYRNYRPNSAYIYQIQKSRDMNVSSVSMTLEALDLDAGVGEYLLIGSGDNPFQGPPPIFISTASTKKRKYQINDENAYIVFVTTSTRKRRNGFKIRWEHKGTKIKVKDDEVEPSEDDILQSIQVCIYNSRAAMEEFKKSKEDQFVDFRKALAIIGSEVAINNTTPEISYSQISFYRISAVESRDKYPPEGLLYVMLKVEGSQKGKAALSRALLQRSFDLYYSSQDVNQYLIGACPKRKRMSSGFYAMLPIFCGFLMLIWIWKQRPFSEYFMRRRNEREPIPPGRMSTAEENHFYSTQPISSPSPCVVENDRRATNRPSPPQTIPDVLVTRCSVFDDGRTETNFLYDPESGHTRPKRMIELSSRPTRNRNVIAIENPAFDYSSERISTQDTVTRRGIERSGEIAMTSRL